MLTLVACAPKGRLSKTNGIDKRNPPQDSRESSVTSTTLFDRPDNSKNSGSQTIGAGEKTEGEPGSLPIGRRQSPQVGAGLGNSKRERVSQIPTSAIQVPEVESPSISNQGNTPDSNGSTLENQPPLESSNSNGSGVGADSSGANAPVPSGSASSVELVQEIAKAQLEKNKVYQLEQIRIIEKAIYESEGIKVSCGSLKPEEDSDCFESLTALYKAYELQLVKPNPQFGKVLSIELSRSKTDWHHLTQLGLRLVPNYKKNPEQFAKLINEFIDSPARRLKIQTSEELYAQHLELEQKLGKSITVGEVKTGMFFWKGIESISEIEYQRGLDLLERALAIYESKIGSHENSESGPLSSSIFEFIELSNESSDLLEDKSQLFIKIGVDESPETVLSHLLKFPKKEQAYYSDLDSTFVNEKFSKEEYSALQVRALDFYRIKGQLDRIVQGLINSYPKITFDCELNTAMGAPNLSLKQCYDGMLKLKAALATRFLKTPLFDSVMLQDSFWGNGLDGRELKIHHANDVSLMSQNLNRATQEFEDYLLEVEEMNNNNDNHVKIY